MVCGGPADPYLTVGGPEFGPVEGGVHLGPDVRDRLGVHVALDPCIQVAVIAAQAEDRLRLQGC